MSERVHLPAMIAGEFDVPRSEARRRIALGRVKLNGRVVTSLDVDLSEYGNGMVQVEMESRPLSDGLVQLLQMQEDALDVSVEGE